MNEEDNGRPGGLVLSLFPGIGLLDMAFEEEGFCVVRGPDLLWGGDIRRFHPPAGLFCGVIGGPPCQAFSRLRHIVEANGFKVAPNLIPEYERVVAEAAPDWFVMENVPAAPEPIIDGYKVSPIMLADHWCGGETSRLRRFSFGTRDGRALHVETVALPRADPFPAVTCDSREVPVQMLAGGKRKRATGGLTSSLSRRGVPGETVGRALSVDEMASRQGVPADFITGLREHGAFTVQALRKGVGNGVPLALGRAVAKAVRRAISERAAA